MHVQIVDLHDHHSKVLMDLYLKYAMTFYAASVCCDWERFTTPSAASPHSDSSHSAQVISGSLGMGYFLRCRTLEHVTVVLHVCADATKTMFKPLGQTKDLHS